VGIGFDASVTFYFSKLKRLRGVMAYLVAIIKTIILQHDAPLMVVNTDVEDWEEESLMFVVCNGSREGGGFLVAPESEPDDGVFHYARVSKVSRLMMLRLVPEVMNGTHGRFEQVSMGHFSRMELRSDRPLHIHMDGETFAGFDSDIQKISIEILPGEIEVMT
jgi:diacylglycerol kinase family enzyme